MINVLMMPYLYMYYRRFLRASHNPNIQLGILRHIVKSNRDTAFGRAHLFSRIHTYEDYAKHVPINNYDYYEQYVNNICSSKDHVLTAETVKLMEPTSGTTAGTKLIPYTDSLQNDFRKGIYPWLYDLYTHNRQLLHGNAYWALSPQTPSQHNCSIPVGFLKDSEYLGIIGNLVERSMTVPSSIASISDIKKWKQITCAYMLSDSNLRFISVWNPQFLTVLLEHIQHNSKTLLQMIARDNRFHASSGRMNTLTQLCAEKDMDFEALWPHLKLISCWTDSYAALALKPLKQLLPHIEIQPKGLISTEAFVSFPMIGQGNVLSVLSHFFEFMDDNNRIYTACKLQKGKEYTVIVTTSGGLYRYNLGDRVKITGFFNALPIMTFLGRNTAVLDFFGEKLEETFIYNIISKHIIAKFNTGFIAFLPRPGKIFSYALHIGSNENIEVKSLENSIDTALQKNYHYRHALSIGQIARLKIFRSSTSLYTEKYLAYMNRKGMKIGDIKPVMISSNNELSHVLEE